MVVIGPALAGPGLGPVLLHTHLLSAPGEIDRCLKKVSEGVEQFEDIWQKVRSTSLGLACSPSLCFTLPLPISPFFCLWNSSTMQPMQTKRRSTKQT